MKEIDVKPRRVVTYRPLFIWGLTAFWVAFFAAQLWVTGWDWAYALRFAMPAFIVGGLMGIRFRDTP